MLTYSWCQSPEVFVEVVVIGAQWGDEGKGKIVDYLANEAQIIVRYASGDKSTQQKDIERAKKIVRLYKEK